MINIIPEIGISCSNNRYKKRERKFPNYSFSEDAGLAKINLFYWLIISELLKIAIIFCIECLLYDIF